MVSADERRIIKLMVVDAEVFINNGKIIMKRRYAMKENNVDNRMSSEMKERDI